MKLKTLRFIYLFLSLLTFEGLIAQDLSLRLASLEKNDIEILNKIDFTSEHQNIESINKEVQKISMYLKRIGYFMNSLDSIKKTNKLHTAYFSLKNKIEKAIININAVNIHYFKKIPINENTITIPIEDLEKILAQISSNLDLEGKSFSTVQLKQIKIVESKLFAELYINESNKRTINRVIVKGYEGFPKSYLKNYFNIKSNTLFNQQKTREISELSKNIQFAREIKTPEVLFTKDSTLLYMYFKKTQNNSFDGIINFTSKEDGGVLFTGNVNLKLNNILNKGEQFQILWNSITKERSEFSITSSIPFIFNSKASPELTFLIYKQDSTFLNTTFKSKIFYNLNSKAKIGFTFSSESSENLSDKVDINVNSFSNYFFGIQYQYNVTKNDAFLNDKLYFKINPTFGNRKTNLNSFSQHKFEATTSYILDINQRNSIYLKNQTGHLNSKSENYFENELFRIGGPTSIRGFNEQSIFTKSYSLFNFEYRYLTSDNSYFYTISDIGIYAPNYNRVLGLGLGYLFISNKSLINISMAIGKQNNNSFETKNSKLNISWTNYF